MTKLDVKVPVIVRLSGTNVEKGRQILDGSDVNLITAETLAEAAEKSVAAAKSVAA
jgi:malate-CoA ligase subunit beta